MDYDVIEARYVRDFVVWLRFRDGTAGEVDLGPELWGEVFEPLRDVEYFQRFTLDPEADTLVWPNGADFDPATLHDWPDVADQMAAMARRWAQQPPPTTARASSR